MTDAEGELGERVVRTGEDEIALHITRRERAILRALFEDVEAVIAAPPLDDEWDDDVADEGDDDSPPIREAPDPDEPDPDEAVRDRLYPSAIPDDERADASFRRLVQRDLEADRRAWLATAQATLDEPVIDDRQADAWLHALNDVRLVMGTRLEVTDETEAAPIEPDDPDAAARMVYAYVGWLLGQFVDVLAATLPDLPDAPDAPDAPRAVE